MSKLKHVLSVLFLLVSITLFAQAEYEIYTTTISEKFNSEKELQSRRIWTSGTQDKTIFNIDLTVDANNIVRQLTINDAEIIPPRFQDYKDLTEYIIKYIDGEVLNIPTAEKSKTKVTREEPAEGDKATDSDKRALMDLIKVELIKDKLIDNPQVFDFMLTFDSLYINAKKQEQEVFEKYQALYGKYSVVSLSNGTYFQITQTL